MCSLDDVRPTLHVGLDARVSLDAAGTLAKPGDGRFENLLPTARDVDRRAALDQRLAEPTPPTRRKTRGKWLAFIDDLEADLDQAVLRFADELPGV